MGDGGAARNQGGTESLGHVFKHGIGIINVYRMLLLVFLFINIIMCVIIVVIVVVIIFFGHCINQIQMGGEKIGI